MLKRANAGQHFAPPGEFAKADQRQREQRAENDAHAGSEQSGLDGIAHQKNAAEREREAADPDHPLGAEAAFEIAIIARRRWCGLRPGGRAGGFGGRLRCNAFGLGLVVLRPAPESLARLVAYRPAASR